MNRNSNIESKKIDFYNSVTAYELRILTRTLEQVQVETCGTHIVLPLNV